MRSVHKARSKERSVNRRWQSEGMDRAAAWGGFSNGKLDVLKIDDGFGGHNERLVPAIFISHKEARRQYQDVRKIRMSYLEGNTIDRPR
jgi:hypothetical protein